MKQIKKLISLIILSIAITTGCVPQQLTETPGKTESVQPANAGKRTAGKLTGDRAASTSR